jgi:hypothetical protein
MTREYMMHKSLAYDLPGCITNLNPYAITWFELIFTLKDTYKSQIQNRGLGEMNGINFPAISYIRAIKKMRQRHFTENKTVTIASVYCRIRPRRGLHSISCHHYTEMNTGVYRQTLVFGTGYYTRMNCENEVIKQYWKS